MLLLGVSMSLNTLNSSHIVRVSTALQHDFERKRSSSTYPK